MQRDFLPSEKIMLSLPEERPILARVRRLEVQPRDKELYRVHEEWRGKVIDTP